MQKLSTNVFKVENTDDLNDVYWAWVDDNYDGEPPTHPINLSKFAVPLTVEFKRARTGRTSCHDSAIQH